MVNPLDFIPKLSGFSPMPLGIMAPFMGYQSAALAYNFGLNYEFGKRVIKSMSNEKFNEIANDPILLNELTSRHHDVLLKAFINEVPKVDKIQDLIIKKMVELEFAKIKVMPELIAQIPKGFLEGIFSLAAGDVEGGVAAGKAAAPTGRTRGSTPTVTAPIIPASQTAVNRQIDTIIKTQTPRRGKRRATAQDIKNRNGYILTINNQANKYNARRKANIGLNPQSRTYKTNAIAMATHLKSMQNAQKTLALLLTQVQF